MSNKRKKRNDTPLWIRIVCGILGVLMVLGVFFMALPYMGQSFAYAQEETPPAVEVFPTDVMISVGLHCDSEAVVSFTVKSNDSISLSYRKSDSRSEELFSYPAGELTAAIDANLYRYGTGLTTENLGIAAMGGYHIQISYYTFSELGVDDRDNPVYIEPGVATTITDGYDRDTVNDYMTLLDSVSAVQSMGQPMFPYYTANKTYIRLGGYYTAEEAEAALSALENELTLKAEVVSPSDDVLTIFDSVTWTPVCELSTEQYMLCMAPENDIPFTDPAGHSYRGSLLFDGVDEESGALMQVINRLPLEEYVAALLSYEVSADENEELLKAMAVILRTEAIRHTNAHSTSGYDVCSDSHCHIFTGSMANAASIRKAVLETAGEILTYGGKPIYTPFTTMSGSSTISSEDAFDKSMAYLPALITPWEEALENSSRWSIELTPYELYRLLSEVGYAQIKGNIASVVILNKADGSDYVTELSFTDHFGNSVTVSGSEQIRTLFGGLIPSTNFVVGKAGEEVSVIHRTMNGEGLDYTESSETLMLVGTYDSFIFNGVGVGCGVGFSIGGGRSLCKMGYTYDQILGIYYPETKISE